MAHLSLLLPPSLLKSSIWLHLSNEGALIPTLQSCTLNLVLFVACNIVLIPSPHLDFSSSQTRRDSRKRINETGFLINGMADLGAEELAERK